MRVRSISTISALSVALALCGCTRPRETAQPLPQEQRPAPRPELAGLGTKEHPVIVRLAGRREVVTVSGGPNGPVYSVSNFAGRTVLSNATLDELGEKHPELYRQIKSLVATDASEVTGSGGAVRSGEPIMRADAPVPWAGRSD